MTNQDYDDLAADYDYIASMLIQAQSRADMLGVPTPVTVADVLTWAAKLRARDTDPEPEP